MVTSQFKSIQDIPEGYILSSWFFRRMIKNKKNILIATCGETGSGKSWSNLRICEIWYEKYFKKPFPIENVCFSTDEVIQRLKNGNLEIGEILILEEAGVNMSSLEFQSKIARTFNFVLQSFRTKRIGLMVNLPYFVMLNKQTRMLMHMLLESEGINQNNSKVMIKPLHLKQKQRVDKLYTHYPKVLIDGVFEKVQRIEFGKPSKALVEAYEHRKLAFVNATIEKAEQINAKDQPKEKVMSKMWVRAWYLREICELNYIDIAKILDVHVNSAVHNYRMAEKRGFNEKMLQKYENYIENLKKFKVKPEMLLPTNNIEKVEIKNKNSQTNGT